ncbi:MAG: hypothetical protein LBT50_01810 [Prevotellaceae bacterium]|jgi:hypothetical protein|nr:hypothetical protein [Prevotellaceae bacterium]
MPIFYNKIQRSNPSDKTAPKLWHLILKSTGLVKEKTASVLGSVSGVIADILKALWKRFNNLFCSSRKIIFIDEVKEPVIINEYGCG